MAALSHLYEFFVAVVVTWKGLLASVFFVVNSLLNLLPEERRQEIDRRFSPENRRKFLIRASGALFFVSAYSAWDDERAKFEEASGKPTEIKELRDQVAKFTSRRWEPLTASEAVALKAKLRLIFHQGKIFIICMTEECGDFARSFSGVLEDVKWEFVFEGGLPTNISEGIGIWSTQDAGQQLADALEIATNGRTKAKAVLRKKTGLPAIDQDIEVWIGWKPK